MPIYLLTFPYIAYAWRWSCWTCISGRRKHIRWRHGSERCSSNIYRGYFSCDDPFIQSTEWGKPLRSWSANRPESNHIQHDRLTFTQRNTRIPLAQNSQSVFIQLTICPIESCGLRSLDRTIGLATYIYIYIVWGTPSKYVELPEIPHAG